MLSAKDLNPCFLVVSRVSVHGGIQYNRKFFTSEDTNQGGTNQGPDTNQGQDANQGPDILEWETKRTINNKAEYTEAQALRGKINRDLAKFGANSPVGLIMPVDKEPEFRAALRRFQEDCATFNATARYSRIVLNVLLFKIRGENEQALSTMLDDLNEILAKLKSASDRADYQSMRDLVTRMGGYSSILPDAAGTLLDNAVANARAQAREIRKAIEKRGERIENLQKQFVNADLETLRFMLVDTGEGAEGAEDFEDSDFAVIEAENRFLLVDTPEDSDPTDPDNCTDFAPILYTENTPDFNRFEA